MYTAPTVRWLAPRIEVQKSSEVAGFISLVFTAKRKGQVFLIHWVQHSDCHGTYSISVGTVIVTINHRVIFTEMDV